MGRRAPRSIASAIGRIRGDLEPPTPLAAIQARWPELIGEAIAAVTHPRSERQGTLTVNCADAVWTEELTLMREDLLARLREALGEQAPADIRFRTGSLEESSY